MRAIYAQKHWDGEQLFSEWFQNVTQQPSVFIWATRHHRKTKVFESIYTSLVPNCLYQCRSYWSYD